MLLTGDELSALLIQFTIVQPKKKEHKATLQPKAISRLWVMGRKAAVLFRKEKGRKWGFTSSGEQQRLMQNNMFNIWAGILSLVESWILQSSNQAVACFLLSLTFRPSSRLDNVTMIGLGTLSRDLGIFRFCCERRR